MKVSCGLLPDARIVERARLAESLGYDRVWSYDSPALYGDVFIALGRVAEATDRIGLGTGVLVPHTRHVLVTASAIAAIEQLAPGRLAIAIGTGFTARQTFGQKAIPWNRLERYIRDLRALLRGETVEVDGRALRMLHPAPVAPARPIATPILVAANGARGLAVAREVGDGVLAAAAPIPGFAWSALLQAGTVLEEGENLHSPRVVEAIGPAVAAMYHGAYGAGGVDALPGGSGWREEIEAFPEAERHLHVHEGHFVELSERDRRHIDMTLGAATLTGRADEVAERLAGLEAAGATEIMYCPMGDVERELRAMASAAGFGARDRTASA